MKPIANMVEQNLLDKLRILAKTLLEEEDDLAAKELQEIGDKLCKEEIVIAFCGHFSAGKSSLINRLCGKQVLPSSPLPTSANVVMIRNGLPRAVLSSSDPSKPPSEVPVQTIEQYARNGLDYTRIELWNEVELLGQGGVLLDTPGVDSNDAGHALAAHSALHLADIVFYVMDYNHVSSETNLSFAKSLSDYGKPLYMVVNQMDKHREQELPFEQYRSSVEQAFRVWNVKSCGTFYISLKDEELPGNMLPGLKQSVGRLLDSGSSLLEYSAYTSAAQSLQGYFKRRAAIEEPERQALEEEAGGDSDIIQMEEEFKKLEASGGADEQIWESHRQEWLKQLSSMLETSQLMIPSVRELASRYLESRSPGFKVKGWFGSGKTENERLKRRDDFLQALGEQVDAQVNWHVRQELRSIGQYLQIWNEVWEQELDRVLPKVEESWISESLPGGALLSGEATLHYAAAVAAGVTARYRRAAASMLDAMLAVPSPLRASIAAAAEERRAELAARLPAARRLAALDAAAKAREARL
ncbi:dynamin family protein, partial [Paenibacillus puldeungensis]